MLLLSFVWGARAELLPNNSFSWIKEESKNTRERQNEQFNLISNSCINSLIRYRLRLPEKRLMKIPEKYYQHNTSFGNFKFNLDLAKAKNLDEKFQQNFQRKKNPKFALFRIDLNYIHHKWAAHEQHWRIPSRSNGFHLNSRIYIRTFESNGTRTRWISLRKGKGIREYENLRTFECKGKTYPNDGK